jgi:hypothetical protein
LLHSPSLSNVLTAMLTAVVFAKLALSTNLPEAVPESLMGLAETKELRYVVVPVLQEFID